MAEAPAKRWGWWDTVSSSEEITQGDLLRRVPIDGRERWDDLIVLTHECDFQKPGTTVITLCPVVDIKEWIDERAQREAYEQIVAKGGGGKVRDRVIAGWLRQLTSGESQFNMVALNDVEQDDRVGFVVNLAEPVALPREYVNRWHAKQDHEVRRRLLPPYREYLAQAFARMYMRVACPTDVGQSLPDSALQAREGMIESINKRIADGRREIDEATRCRGTDDPPLTDQEKHDIAHRHCELMLQ